MTLGERIRELREDIQLSQRQIGALIEVDGAFISKVEHSEKPISRTHLKILAQFFKVKEADLQALWLADKVRNILKDDHYAVDAINILKTEFN